jgi:hypothetical protein
MPGPRHYYVVILHDKQLFQISDYAIIFLEENSGPDEESVRDLAAALTG